MRCGLNWCGSCYGPVAGRVDTILNFVVPQTAENFLIRRVSIGFRKSTEIHGLAEFFS